MSEMGGVRPGARADTVKRGVPMAAGAALKMGVSA